MSSNNTMNLVSDPKVLPNITKTTKEHPYQYDIKEEKNSNIRYMMSYYGY
jgi:hypothetical protein